MTEFNEDVTLSHRPEPDRDVLALAHNITLREEDPVDKWHRQQWEVTIQAVRVALDAWRKIWPLEAEAFGAELSIGAREIEHALALVYAELDQLTRDMVGDLMYRAQRGSISDDELDMLKREEGLE